MRSSWTARVAFLVASLVLGAPGRSPAQELKPVKPLAPDHEHLNVRNARSFDEGWLLLHDAYRQLEETIAGGSAFDISSEANAVATLGARLGGILLEKSSPFTPERSASLGQAVQDVVATAIGLHIAADQGELNRVGFAFARLQEAVAAASALVPESFVCPMHCEGTKTYPTPGLCPECGMNVRKVTTAKYAVTVTPDAPIAPGADCDLTFTIEDPTGARVTALEVVHEKILHLLMVSSDLSWYAHEHPEIQKDGSFRLRFRFPHAGKYVLFHDFTPKDVGMQVVPVTLEVEGEPPKPVALVPDAKAPKALGKYSVSLDTNGALVTDAPSLLRYTVSRDGVPVADLEPYLGAMGHLIVVSQNLRSFVHSHPKEASPAPKKGGPVVEFEAHFDRPGRYKAWAQFQHKGEVLTFPFTFDVAPANRSRKGK